MIKVSNIKKLKLEQMNAALIFQLCLRVCYQSAIILHMTKDTIIGMK